MPGCALLGDSHEGTRMLYLDVMAVADIYEFAESQAGYFTAAQARAEVGWTAQHLNYHVHAGNVERLARGIYRLAYHPRAEDEEFIIVWLWSGQVATFSHQTALSLLGLSDLQANRVHITLPQSWSKRRLRWPHGVVPHFASLGAQDKTWVGNVPVTRPARTLHDCATAGVRPDEVRKAVADALVQGTATEDDARRVHRILEDEARAEG